MGTSEFIHQPINIDDAPSQPNWIVDVRRCFPSQLPSTMGSSLPMVRRTLGQSRGALEGGQA